MLSGATILHALRNAAGIVAANTGARANLLTPTAAWILQYTGVVKCVFRRIKIRVGPNGSKFCTPDIVGPRRNAQIDRVSHGR